MTYENEHLAEDMEAAIHAIKLLAWEYNHDAANQERLQDFLVDLTYRIKKEWEQAGNEDRFSLGFVDNHDEINLKDK